jgi:tetratricopeptide (TPR) repeat protein
MTGDVGTPGLARAQALLLANRAEDALRELATLPPDHALGIPAACLRCAALLELERWPEAAQAARAALAAGHPDPDLLYLLGRAEHRLGHLDVAERALLDGLALAPSDVDLLCGYAQLCITAGQVDKAAKLAERAAAEDPDAPVVYATRIQVAYAWGDDKTAQRLSQEFVAQYPDSPAAHALHGGMNAVRGRVTPAYAGFARASAEEPTSEELAEAAVELRIAKHPLLLPVRPFTRFGPFKSWLVVISVIVALRAVGLLPLALVLSLAWFLLCVYSWVVPPLVRRRLRKRWLGWR